jgi:hypothetical protein
MDGIGSPACGQCPQRHPSSLDSTSMMRSLLVLNSVIAIDASVLLQTIEIYEYDRLDFAEAYPVAGAESSGVGVVAFVRSE